MHTNTHTRNYVYLSLSRVHLHPLTHEHTRACTHTRTHAHTLSVFLCLSHTHPLTHTLHKTHLLRGRRDLGVIASKGGHGGGHDSEITGRLYIFSKSLLHSHYILYILNSEQFFFGGFLQVLSPLNVTLDKTCKLFFQVVLSNFYR